MATIKQRAFLFERSFMEEQNLPKCLDCIFNGGDSGNHASFFCKLTSTETVDNDVQAIACRFFIDSDYAITILLRKKLYEKI